jgi:Family of unknown function (DUF6318)
VRGLSGLIVLAVCAAALAACGGSADNFSTVSPTPSAPGSRSASGSASASPTAAPTQTGPLLTGHGVSPGEVPPTRSDASKQHTSDGAISFAFYFYRALDWSIATTNSYLLRQISATTCQSCNTYINEINKVEAAGGYSTGARITIDEVARVQDTLVPAEYVMQVELHQSPQVLVTSAGAVPSTYSGTGKQNTSQLYLGWGPSGWQALEISHT